jgi:hypothetical protein
MGMIHGVNENVRETQQHTIYESESWVEAFNLELELTPMIQLIVAGFMAGYPGVFNTTTFEEEMFIAQLTPSLLKDVNQVITICYEYLLKKIKKQSELRLVKGRWCSKLVEFQVSTQGVSLHIPLHRILGHFLYNAVKYWGLTLEQLLPLGCDGTLGDLPIILIEHPLRIQVLLSQIRAGLFYSRLLSCFFFLKKIHLKIQKKKI